ncbi:MAG: general secretion pathway protein GspB [Candidatus Thiodiazotropha sp.]
MSLILEALKKAERQHKLGEVPRIRPDTEQPGSAASHRLGWLMLSLFALVLLGIGIYLGSGSWFRSQPQQQAPALSGTESRQHDTPSTGVPEREAPLENGQISSAPPLQSTTPTRESSAPVQEMQGPAAATATPQAQEIEPPREVVSEPPPPPPPPRPPKPLHEMPSGFVANLPPMSIDIHSYDKRAAKRYVLINMEKYREGDYLAEGPRLVEILPQGAVMEHMGERFILPIGNQ